MFALRCTRKLLNRGAPEVLEAPVPPTTLLGDWYANVLFTRPEHLVLCLSERTLLPVVVTAKDVKKLPYRVAEAAAKVLGAIGIDPDHVAEEVRKMEHGYLAVTANRKVLGSLNDFMFHLEHGLHMRPGLTLHERALCLSEMPSAAIEFAFPSEATRALFSATIVMRAAQSAV